MSRRVAGRGSPQHSEARRATAGEAADADATRGRLLAAATELFATRGFRGTSIRDITARAGANVAAGHYHFGSKEKLYLEVLRRQFTLVGASLERRGVIRSTATLQRATRRELEAQLHTRIHAMLDVLLGPPPQPHGALMLREMGDPTEALPIVVREFIDPQIQEMKTVVARLAPRAGAATLQLLVFSIVGQVLFYRFNMPVLLLYLGQARYPRGFTTRIARHIAAFSLAGIAHSSAARGGTARRRRVTPAPARTRRHG